MFDPKCKTKRVLSILIVGEKATYSSSRPQISQVAVMQNEDQTNTATKHIKRLSHSPVESIVSCKQTMGLRALPLSPSQTTIPPHVGFPQHFCSHRFIRSSTFIVSAKQENGEKEEPKKSKQSLFSSVTEALDFSQVRSAQDAELLDEARDATRSGGRMSREQYGALRRKIGGTYKDFFKSYVEVDGEYVEEGWVDKTCKVCKKDTRGEARQIDKFGRYVHVACLDKSNSSGNFFTRLFSR